MWVCLKYQHERESFQRLYFRLHHTENKYAQKGIQQEEKWRNRYEAIKR